LSATIIGRPVEADAGSRLVLNRAVKWVKACNDHPECRRGTASPNLPRRVIDIGTDNNSIRLKETYEESGTYTTLSHCWGSSEQLTTTKASLAARQKGISFEELPKTFQDAIILTRELDVRYIWIDSLCICQDDGDDWDRESAKMASVYSNSYLTIAATQAKNSSVGLFAPRTTPEYITIPYTSSEGIQGTVVAFNLPIRKEAMPDHYMDMPSEPLQQRAWALQERVLARRTLHYATHEMYFECSHGFVSENGTRFDWRYNDISHLDTKEDDAPANLEEMPPSTTERWYELLRAYGTRKLTFESDKLPALSGLAHLYGQKLNDQYVARLWKNSLIEGLLWQSFGDGVNRVSEYRAPSWSWASIDGRTGASKSFPRWTSTHLAKVIDYGFELKGENPYGEVKNGWIKIQAALLRLSIGKVAEPFETAVPMERIPPVYLKNHSDDIVRCRFDVDYFTMTAEGSEELTKRLKAIEIFALVLMKQVGPKGQSYYSSLMVTPTHEDGGQTMRRLGFMTHDGGQAASPYDNQSTEQRIITLV